MIAFVALAVPACSGAHAQPAGPSFGSGAGAPTLTEVTALLQRHSAAVLARATDRYLADVDPAPVSASFHLAQQQTIAGLSGVPLHSWQYSIDAPVTDPSVVTAAATRLGAPASIVHVTLSYALDDVDSSPVTHDLWWTFVQRHGHVYVAADGDMAGLGGPSWKGPWDFGPIVAQHGNASLVLGHPSDESELAAISAEVDAAVPAVTAVWGTDWSRQVAVIVPGSSTEFAALAGQQAPSVVADTSAETVFESSASSTGGDTGARVILNPSALDRLTPLGREIVLRHEITHVATAAVTAIATPRWLVEGFADYVANLGTGQSVATAAAELHAEVARGEVPTALPGDTDFASTTRLAAVYQEAWLACRLIAARAGQAALVRFYTFVGDSPLTADAAVTAAFSSFVHESEAAFVVQWRAYLRAQL